MIKRKLTFPRHWTLAGAALALSGSLAWFPATGASDVELLEEWPGCEFERLGKVESKDGREVGKGGGSRRANLERAEAGLRRKAGKLDATRLVLTQRKIQRDGNKIRYVHLVGVAIGPCEDT